nr:MAG TPA: hypothetical protein [Caudoviricetes sp.]
MLFRRHFEFEPTAHHSTQNLTLTYKPYGFSAILLTHTSWSA